MDYTIIETRQFGTEADNPDEAMKNHLAGESTQLTVNYQAHPRPARGPMQGVPGVLPGASAVETPTAAQKLAQQK